MRYTTSNTIGEVLIVLGAMATFAFLVQKGTVTSVQDLWTFAAMLGVIVLFYFFILLAKAIHTFMVGGDSFWWEKYEEQQKKTVAKK